MDIFLRFAENAAEFVRQHNLDGLDLDWEFPAFQIPVTFSSILELIFGTYSYEVDRFSYLVQKLRSSLQVRSLQLFV